MYPCFFRHALRSSGVIEKYNINHWLSKENSSWKLQKLALINFDSFFFHHSLYDPPLPHTVGGILIHFLVHERHFGGLSCHCNLLIISECYDVLLTAF